MLFLDEALLSNLFLFRRFQFSEINGTVMNLYWDDWRLLNFQDKRDQGSTITSLLVSHKHVLDINGLNSHF